MSGRTPNSPFGGAHFVEVRNSTSETWRKNLTVSSKRTMTIPTVVKIVRYAQILSSIFMTRSLTSLVRLLRFQSPTPDRVPPASIDTENPPKLRDHRYGGRSQCRPPYVTSRPVPVQTA